MRPSRALVLATLAFSMSGVGCSSSDPNPIVVADTGKPDTGKPDTGKPDTGTGDTSVGDTSVADTAVADTTVADTTVGPDTGTKCDQHTGDKCNMAVNDCPTNQTCVYTSTANECVALTLGPNADGEPCSDTDGCAPGLLCQPNSSGSSAGVCSRPCCQGDDSACKANGQNGTCSINIIDAAKKSLYHLCSYSETVCHPFKYDCAAGDYCDFTKSPDVFTCASPAPGKTIGEAPGGDCNAVNDCGESQGCFSITRGDGGSTGDKCWLFCYLKTPTGFTKGTTPAGRFPADGTCTIGGTSYGTCTSVGFPDYSSTGGGQLGVCIK